MSCFRDLRGRLLIDRANQRHLRARAVVVVVVDREEFVDKRYELAPFVYVEGYMCIVANSRAFLPAARDAAARYDTKQVGPLGPGEILLACQWQ